MIRAIIEKLTRKNEILCPAAKAVASKISKILGKADFATLSRGGEDFEVDTDHVIGGYITAKNSKGKLVTLDLCDDDYKVA